MLSVKSALAGGQDRAAQLTRDWLPGALEAYPLKFYWFAKSGYIPHIWQATMHGASNGDRLARFRHLVAGRRGGKTKSAAFEVAYYATHPREFHRDAHARDSSTPLWIWVLTKDYPAGNPARRAFFEALDAAGLVKNKDYTYNKTEQRVEFNDGTLVEFKTAVDPQSLRGPGLDILWIDEAAFIPTAEAWTVVRPGLSDKLGLVLTTTTPAVVGKNWLWEEFFDGIVLEDPAHFRVEYVSLDNPYFEREEWEYAKRTYHPIHFKREYMASWDAFEGVVLQGDWLHYWVSGDVDPNTEDVSIKHLRTEEGSYRLRIFMGVDPSVGATEGSDQFAMAVIGVSDTNRAYVLDTFIGRIDFPTQLTMLREWQLKWRPELIGVEANAYQAVLAQQAARLDTFPGIVPVFARGKKPERIMSMSPLFKLGVVRINRAHADFIDQWLGYNPPPPFGTGPRQQKDDLLDAVEIALGIAPGILLPGSPHESLIEEKRVDHSDVSALVKAQLQEQMERTEWGFDPDLGDYY